MRKVKTALTSWTKLLVTKKNRTAIKVDVVGFNVKDNAEAVSTVKNGT